MKATALERTAVADRVRAERERQGLPATVNDPAVLGTIAAVIARGGADHAGAA